MKTNLLSTGLGSQLRRSSDEGEYVTDTRLQKRTDNEGGFPSVSKANADFKFSRTTVTSCPVQSNVGPSPLAGGENAVCDLLVRNACGWLPPISPSSSR